MIKVLNEWCIELVLLGDKKVHQTGANKSHWYKSVYLHMEPSWLDRLPPNGFPDRGKMGPIGQKGSDNYVYVDGSLGSPKQLL